MELQHHSLQQVPTKLEIYSRKRVVEVAIDGTGDQAANDYTQSHRPQMQSTPCAARLGILQHLRGRSTRSLRCGCPFLVSKEERSDHDEVETIRPANATMVAISL